METMVIHGGAALRGSVDVEGAKNAVLPALAASLLVPGETVLVDVPDLDDVHTMKEVLESTGATIQQPRPGVLSVQTSGVTHGDVPVAPVQKMRASFLVLGPLAARLGRAAVALPGGCAIGSRPVDLHLKGLEALGFEISVTHGFVSAQAERLHGARIYLDVPSVGATEHIMMAAVLAAGTTQIENAAEEPEIVDLATMLSAMGAKIHGAGTRTILIEGGSALQAVTHRVIPDRIEAGTMMVAAAITGGDVTVRNVMPDHLRSIIAKLREAGAEVFEVSDAVRIIGRGRPLPLEIKTLPYPGFPTDMQPQFMALCAVADGTSSITENIFENRFLHVDELRRLGAEIDIEGRRAVIHGQKRLTGAPVNATDLRAGAGLVLAGLVADGVTQIHGAHHIRRGYMDLAGKLRSLGADIWSEARAGVMAL